MSLGVVIPTYRRMPRQATLTNLPESWIGRTTLVVDEEDAALYKLYKSNLCGVRLVVHPPEIKSIAAKRAWIIRNWELVSYSPKIVMLDDDLRFSIRTGDGTKLRQAESADMEFYLSALDQGLELYHHLGWSMRQGNNTCKDFLVYGARMCYVLGYHAQRILQLETDGLIELGRVKYREDMDLTLQLLKLGYPNEVRFDIAADQVSGFGAKGGCSEERTIADSNAEALKMAELHPGLVKVVWKSYEGSPDRMEVVCYWKKALQAGMARMEPKP